jgi:hypothetical protein
VTEPGLRVSCRGAVLGEDAAVLGLTRLMVDSQFSADAVNPRDFAAD